MHRLPFVRACATIAMMMMMCFCPTGAIVCVIEYPFKSASWAINLTGAKSETSQAGDVTTNLCAQFANRTKTIRSEVDSTEKKRKAFSNGIINRIIRRNDQKHLNTNIRYTRTIFGSRTPTLAKHEYEHLFFAADYFNTTLSLNEPRRVFIHIGKTGGSTWRHTKHFHLEAHILRTIFYHPISRDHLYISIRNPLMRVISAWNYLQNEERRVCNLCVTPECHKMFPTLNSVAENLERNETARIVFRSCILHLRYNYEFYLGSLLDFIGTFPERVHLLRQEHLEEDSWRHFGLNINESFLSSGFRTLETYSNLSEKAVRNLNKWLNTEFAIYHWLLELKNLEP